MCSLLRLGESEEPEAVACEKQSAEQSWVSYGDCVTASKDCHAGPEGEHGHQENRFGLWTNIS